MFNPENLPSPDNRILGDMREASRRSPRWLRYSLGLLLLVGLCLLLRATLAQSPKQDTGELERQAVCSLIAETAPQAEEQSLVWNKADKIEQEQQRIKREAEAKKADLDKQLASYRKQLNGQTCLSQNPASPKTELSPSPNT